MASPAGDGSRSRRRVGELLVRLLHRGQVLETAPADDLIRVRVPDDRAVLAQWSA